MSESDKDKPPVSGEGVDDKQQPDEPGRYALFREPEGKDAGDIIDIYVKWRKDFGLLGYDPKDCQVLLVPDEQSGDIKLEVRQNFTDKVIQTITDAKLTSVMLTIREAKLNPFDETKCLAHLESLQ